MKLKKRSVTLLFIIMCILQISVMTYWENRKAGFFIDEVLTLEYSKNWLDRSADYKLDHNEEWFDTWHTRADYLDFITLKEENSAFQYSLKQNFQSFIHGHNYFWFLNVVESFFPGVLSKWFSFGLNIIFFVFTNVFLYLIALKILKDRVKALVPVTFWGFCTGAISLVTYVRFYMIWILCMTITTYLFMELLKKDNTLKKRFMLYAGIGISLFMGLRNSELTVFYTVALTITFCILQLVRKQYRTVIELMVIELSAGIYVLANMVRNYASSGLVIGIKNAFHSNTPIHYYRKLLICINEVRNAVLGDQLGIILVWLLLTVLLIYCILNGNSGNWRAINKRKIMMFAMAIIPSIIYFCIIVVVLATPAWRYLSCIFPFAVLGIVVAFQYFCSLNEKLNRAYYGIIVFVMMLTMATSYSIPNIHELYEETADMKACLNDQYPDTNSVILFENTLDGKDGLYRDGLVWQDSTYFYHIKSEQLSDYNMSFLQFCDNSKGVLLWINNKVEDDQRMEYRQLFLKKSGYKNIMYVTQTYESNIFYCYN
ncbi:MAG: hypothetical protein PHX08_13540 [Lachnospiraceae bacterium]|nr:hypothetical protein [Lachnospiraceae bacterium]